MAYLISRELTWPLMGWKTSAGFQGSSLSSRGVGGFCRCGLGYGDKERTGDCCYVG